MYLQGKLARWTTVLLFGITIAACTRQWFLSVTAEGTTAAFCLSQSRDCSGDGVQFETLEVAEVSKDGERSRVMWSLQAASNVASDRVLKRVTYGQVPRGWKERSAAAPLAKGVYYVVNDQYYFRISEQGPVVVLEREQFFDDMKRP